MVGMPRMFQVRLPQTYQAGQSRHSDRKKFRGEVGVDLNIILTRRWLGTASQLYATINEMMNRMSNCFAADF